ncbi:hypothetical protein [Pseudoalteromonas sp. Of7M-16]|uniref:hypothetical protein n=1 Tax=Pseudoalteromonas sp. Of7M-16 TaxID=2917756 RepID=UPI001EF586BC|nr:hypothetical protein [Pseudoalteromonas sp. Of7M-16]MCG7550968.1 hypothetical protein [Pseudoalteromonas sp. Of7M-16]
MSDKKFINNAVVLSLSCSQPYAAAVAMKGDAIHIMNAEPKPRSTTKIKEWIESKLERWQDNNTTFFIDDPTGTLAGYGYHISLEDKLHDGAFAIHSAIKKLNALSSSGALTKPNTGNWDIPSSLINHRVKDTGESYYQIDWKNLQDLPRLMLLCVHAMTSQDVLQTNYLMQMYSFYDEGDELPHESMFNAIQNRGQ